MKTPHRTLAASALLLGAVGIVVALAGAMAAIALGIRLMRVNDTVFDSIDAGIVAVQERVVAAQQRVEDSKITLDSLENGLRSVTRREVRERLATRLDAEGNVASLTEGLNQTDQWLEASAASISALQQILTLIESLGAPVAPEALAQPLDNIASLRGQVSGARDAVQDVRQQLPRADQEGDGDLQERLSRLLPLLPRVLANLGNMEERLGELSDQLTNTRIEMQDFRTLVRSRLMIAQAAAVLFALWMLAGQACLCAYGWKWFRPDECDRRTSVS